MRRLDAETYNIVYPVVGIKKYPNGVFQIVRECKGDIKSRPPERSFIKMCSKRSLVRLMAVMHATEVTFRSMITLTYPAYYPLDGVAVKRDINVLLQRMRRLEMGSYVWFLEFQTRGAPHIHLLTELGELSPRIRVDWGLYWTQRIALSDWYTEKYQDHQEYRTEVVKMAKFNTRVEFWELLRDESKAKNYVSKYASKERQKIVPKKFASVGRFWGASRDVMPEPVELDHTEDEIRDYLEREGYVVAAWEVLPKMIFKREGAN